MERALIESVANDLAKHQYAVVVPFQYEYYNSKKQLVDMSDDCMKENLRDSDVAVVIVHNDPNTPSYECAVGSAFMNQYINYCVENDINVVFTTGPSDKKVSEIMSIITISGSMKFAQTIQDYVSRLTHAGYIVLVPQHLEKWVHAAKNGYKYNENLSEDEIENLHRIHNKKIEMSRAMIVVTENGYYGDDTKREIGYARSKSIPVHIYDAIACSLDKFSEKYDLNEGKSNEKRDDQISSDKVEMHSLYGEMLTNRGEMTDQ